MHSEPHRPQAQVEAASTAIALWASREWTWDRLDEDVRQCLAAYLGGIVHVVPPWNNWYLFRAITLAFLETVGYRQPDGAVEEALAAMEPLYREPGWYVDGGHVEGSTFDYYTGWADHTYTLLWGLIAGGRADPSRVAEYKRRASAYAADLVHMIGADGAPLVQGRSLLYRNAVVAPLWALELLGVSAVDPGLTRHAAGRVLDYFDRNGAFETGIPSLGWHGEHLPLVQNYSGPASPFWLSKGFLGLLLPLEHPVWTTPEMPLPAESGAFVRIVHAPSLVLHGSAADGIVRALNGGISKDDSPGDPNYARLAFSTRTGPWYPIDAKVAGKSRLKARRAIRRLTGFFSSRRSTISTARAAAAADTARRLVTDNWAGYVSANGQPSVLGAVRVIHRPTASNPVVEHYAASHLLEPDLYPGSRARIVPAIHRRSFLTGGAERRTLRIVRRDRLWLGTTGYCLSDDDVLEPLHGEGWVGGRASDGILTALVDLTSRAELSIEKRGATALGNNSLLPVALWSDAVAREFDQEGVDGGISRLDVGIILGAWTEAEVNAWRDSQLHDA
jgi:hypothetical protein